MSVKNYSLEFAVQAHTELQAMKRLKSLGLSKAEDAKLADLDYQADLFVIRVESTDEELTDDVYKKILGAKDVYILSDELAEYRSRQTFKIVSPIERQLKKLLICVLPETEKVLDDIINTHQKHKTSLKPATRIEWCQKINNFSLGEIIRVLEVDISEIATKNLLTSKGILGMIATSQDFDTLKNDITELMTPKTVWTSISALLEKPADFSYIAKEINALLAVRNDAAHLQTITQQQLDDAKKNKKHVMGYIGKTKSDYQVQLKANMDSISKSMKSIIDSAVRIDPSLAESIRQTLETTYKPLLASIANIQKEIATPLTADIIKNNAKFTTELSKGMVATIEQMKPFPGYKEIMSQFNQSGVQEAIRSMSKEASQLKAELSPSSATSTKKEGEK